MVIRETDGLTGARAASGGGVRGGDEGGGMSGLVVALALIGSVLCVAVLLFVRFAHWAGEHPFAGALLLLLTGPVFYVVLRGMPRARELRRAARAGMAQADREAGVTTAPVPSVPQPAPHAVHDGLTVELHQGRSDFD